MEKKSVSQFTLVTASSFSETAMGIKKTHQDNAGFNYAMAVMK